MNPFDYIKIAGNDKHNAEVDRREQQMIDEHHHQQLLNAQQTSNRIAEESNKIARNALKKSNIAIIVSAFTALFTLGSLIVAIVALCA